MRPQQAGASLDTQLPLLGRGPSSRVMGTRMEESSFVIKWATCSGSRRAVWEAVCRCVWSAGMGPGLGIHITWASFLMLPC